MRTFTLGQQERAGFLAGKIIALGMDAEANSFMVCFKRFLKETRLRAFT